MAAIAAASTYAPSAGAGSDRIIVEDSTINGMVNVDTGAGDDILAIETGSDDGKNSEFKSAASVKLDAVEDEAFLFDPGAHGDRITFDAAFTLDGGDDLDVLSTSDRASVIFLGSVSIANVETQT